MMALFRVAMTGRGERQGPQEQATRLAWGYYARMASPALVALVLGWLQHIVANDPDHMPSIGVSIALGIGAANLAAAWLLFGAIRGGFTRKREGGCPVPHPAPAVAVGSHDFQPVDCRNGAAVRRGLPAMPDVRAGRRAFHPFLSPAPHVDPRAVDGAFRFISSSTTMPLASSSSAIARKAGKWRPGEAASPPSCWWPTWRLRPCRSRSSFWTCFSPIASRPCRCWTCARRSCWTWSARSP